MAAKSLPGWKGEVGVDFSDYPIPGTNCSNCRSLLTATPPLKCGSEDFIASTTPGKDAAEDVIPVDSGNPTKYCCNFWGLGERVAKKKGATAAWARKVRSK